MCITFKHIVSAAVLVAFMCSARPYQGTTLQFDVYRDNEKVGWLTTASEVRDSRIIYTLSSVVNAQVLFDISVREDMTDIFENGRMISGVQSRTINGISQSDNTTLLRGDIYVDEDGDELEGVGSWIGNSMLMMYHKEPLATTVVFSESQRCWVSITTTGAHTYFVKLPNGNTSTFYYENERLLKVVSQTNWGEISFVSK